MFLFRQKEIPDFLKEALTCNFKMFPFMSFFYGDRSTFNSFNLENLKNNDAEFYLAKKILKNGLSFSLEERNTLYFFATSRKTILLKKHKNISFMSFFILYNMLYLKDMSDECSRMHNSPIFKAKNNGLIKKNFILSELLVSNSGCNKKNMKNIDLTHSYSYSEYLSTTAKRFVYLNKDLIIKEKIKDKKLLLSIMDSSKKNTYAHEIFNIDNFVNNFSYIPRDVLILCMSHLEKDDLLHFVNGNIIAKPVLFEDFHTYKSLEDYDFGKLLIEVRESMQNNSHILSRCDDKDVVSIYRKISYGKI